jgi:redox-sensitive bicupin YhaK (pirin superfamily)
VSDLKFIPPHAKDLGGGFVVRRSLPSVQRQAVGPFVFFDHFGPVTAGPQDDHDVRPHPHIGLATVTYLFEGAMMHRDSTGIVQRIEPGAINWMTAGRGIVHSERTPPDLRGRTRRTHGLQLWVAVPAEREQDEPGFQHVEARDVPVVARPGATLRLLVGEGWSARSPVRTLSPTLYVDAALEHGAAVELPPLASERAIYGVDADLEVDGEPLPACTLALLPPAATVRVRAPTAARFVLVGGEPLGHRFMVWNFVSSDRERILKAQDDWEAQRFPRVPGETEFIPLPPRRP